MNKRPARESVTKADSLLTVGSSPVIKTASKHQGGQADMGGLYL